MDSLTAMTGPDPIAGMAAATSETVSNTTAKIGIKLLKEKDAADLAVATMATSLPVNPSLGRNINISA